jgi:hypothetical protein
MKSNPGSGILCLVLASLIIISGCASTTLLTTSPDNAYIYIRGQNRGTTPYKYSDIKVAFSSTPVTFKKTGYYDKNIILKKNEKIDEGALLSGIILYVPFLWIMKYDPYHSYELEKLDSVEVPEAEKNQIPISKSDTIFADLKINEDTIQTQGKYLSDVLNPASINQEERADIYKPMVLLSYLEGLTGIYLRGITAGLGYSLIRNNYLGGNINFKANIFKSRNAPTDYYDDGYRVFAPKDYVNILSLNLVKEFTVPRKSMRLGLEAGPSWVNYSKAEFEPNSSYDPNPDPHVNWIYQIGTKYKYFKSHTAGNTIGVSLKAKMVFPISSFSGIELSVFGNINNLKSVAGLEFVMILGKVAN